MFVEIVSDTICPWCFIGKRRFERALAERPQPELRIGWRPFQLNPEMPSGGIDRQDYLAQKFGGAERAGQVYDPIHAAGKSAGIAFAFGKIRRTPNTINSHRLIHRAAESDAQDAMVEALFRAYFLEGKDIEGVDSLVAIAEGVGMDGAAVTAYLESDANIDIVKAEDATARRMGIQGVPCFVFNRKFAVSGAQEPAVFLKAFDMATADDRGETVAAEKR